MGQLSQDADVVQILSVVVHVLNNEADRVK